MAKKIDPETPQDLTEAKRKSARKSQVHEEKKADRRKSSRKSMIPVIDSSSVESETMEVSEENNSVSKAKTSRRKSNRKSTVTIEMTEETEAAETSSHISGRSVSAESDESSTKTKTPRRKSSRKSGIPVRTPELQEKEESTVKSRKSTGLSAIMQDLEVNEKTLRRQSSRQSAGENIRKSSRKSMGKDNEAETVGDEAPEAKRKSLANTECKYPLYFT